MPVSRQAVGHLAISAIEARKTSGCSNKEYERAFSEVANFLFAQYKKKKQADLSAAR